MAIGADAAIQEESSDVVEVLYGLAQLFYTLVAISMTVIHRI